MAGQISVTSAGIQVPQASEIKQAFQNVFTNALGTDLSLDDSTPQGVIIDDLTQEKQLDNAQILYFLNQMNPETADGVFQDALGSIYSLQRKVATSSVVNCVCTGAPGTLIPGVSSGNPAMAQSVNGDLFQCLIGGTIPSTGTITLQFASVETGEIPVGANTVNSIYNVISGWDTVNNPVAGTVGTEIESRADFEARRKKSLALNATGSLSSVYAHIFDVPGVTDVFVDENDTNSSVTKRGVTLGPHSIYICQNGATDQDALAEAIYNSKSGGCDTNGSNTCSFTEPITGVTYTYNYYTPTDTPIYIKITLGQSISSEAQESVKEVLQDNFNGQNNDGYSKITIGTTIYASRFYTAINKLNNADIILQTVKVSTDGTNWEDALSFNMNVLPTLDIESTSPAYVTFEVAS